MNKPIAALLLGAMTVIGAGSALAEEVSSLRGHAVTDASDPAMNKTTLALPGGFDVAWEKQPPMIPHPIDKYQHPICAKTAV